ncbi:MAG: hypothetical protein OXT65_00490 [Alphaproteobacteria bacterium]|nr:hypothetical protein [Alphaproteobacteria bacterium]
MKDNTLKKLKYFARDCYSVGEEIGLAVTPPILWVPMVPVIGAVLGATVGPIVLGAHAGYNKVRDALPLWKRWKASDAEKSIRQTFGDISVKGYRHYGGGVEMKLEDTRVYEIYKDGRVSPEADIHRMDTHHDREQCVKDMIGNVAHNAAGRSRFLSPGDERFIVVRKKGSASSQFYKVAKIDSLDDAPASVLKATHHYYEGAIGHGEIKEETHYTITPVDTKTAERLRKLGL